MIDDAPVGNVQSFAVGVCFIPDGNVDIAVFDVNFEREYGTACRLPVVFGVKRTESVIAEEIAGVFVDIGVFAPVFLLASYEIPSAKLLDRVVDVFSLCEFEEIRAVQEHSVVTAPRAFGNALEREVRIELGDDLTTGMNFDALGVGHGIVLRCGSGYILRQ